MRNRRVYDGGGKKEKFENRNGKSEIRGNPRENHHAQEPTVRLHAKNRSQLRAQKEIGKGMIERRRRRELGSKPLKENPKTLA
jgi:hypothetical protein